jgi:uncharacterized protein (TIGR02145 family)
MLFSSLKILNVMEIILKYLPLSRWFKLTLMLLLLTPLSSFAQSTTQATFQSQKRIALVIGNGNYLAGMPLANPENDARAIKAALQSVGFTVMEYENINQSQMKKAIDDFGDKLKGNDIGLFFYAGHGIQAKGYNYLIPVDATLKSEEEVEYDCVQADRVLAKMETGGTKVNIIILDACRNNPYERSWTRSATGKGLAFMNAPRGSLIAYATSPGSTASDGSGNNGLYTSAILESMKIPDITILEMFQNVRNIVTQKSNNQQIPWESTSLTGNFYFSTGEITKPEIQKKIQLTPAIDTTSQITPSNKTISIDSHDIQQYKTIKIGHQFWMAENLKTSKYADGTSIPLVTDATEWTNLTSGAYCIHNNDIYNATTYGCLYNWYAVIDSHKICPINWHVPTDLEWKILIDYLGGEDKADLKLKSITGWNCQYPATNETGFTAIPTGTRFDNGSFSHIDIISGAWWSSSENSSTSAWLRYTYCDSFRFGRNSISKQSGISIRCIRDY